MSEVIYSCQIYYLSIYLSIHLSLYLSLSIYLYIYLFIFLSLSIFLYLSFTLQFTRESNQNIHTYLCIVSDTCALLTARCGSAGWCTWAWRWRENTSVRLTWQRWQILLSVASSTFARYLHLASVLADFDLKWVRLSTNRCVHGVRYFTNFLFVDLKATVGTYELRCYGGKQWDRQEGVHLSKTHLSHFPSFSG